MKKDIKNALWLAGAVFVGVSLALVTQEGVKMLFKKA